MTMVGGDGEGSRKGGRPKSLNVIFDDFGGTLMTLEYRTIFLFFL